MIPTTHHALEQAHPKYAEHAAELEAHRVTRGGTPTRQFPCLGVFKADGMCGTAVQLVCSECGFEITCPSPSTTQPEESELCPPF